MTDYAIQKATKLMIQNKEYLSEMKCGEQITFLHGSSRKGVYASVGDLIILIKDYFLEYYESESFRNHFEYHKTKLDWSNAVKSKIFNFFFFFFGKKLLCLIFFFCFCCVLGNCRSIRNRR